MNDKLFEAVARAVRVHCHAVTKPEDAARAALAAIEESGHAIVPVEPTTEMLNAWHSRKCGFHFQDEIAPVDTSDDAAYAAMLAARPKVQS